VARKLDLQIDCDANAWERLFVLKCIHLFILFTVINSIITTIRAHCKNKHMCESKHTELKMCPQIENLLNQPLNKNELYSDYEDLDDFTVRTEHPIKQKAPGVCIID
jgi:hypothetical protein